MQSIPVHQLSDRGIFTGIDIRRFSSGEKIPADVEEMGVHRDDHYLFFLLEEGYAHMMIDFHEVTFVANSLHYLLPGQVHHPLKNRIYAGWFVAVDALLIPPDYRSVFENQLILQQPYNLDPAAMQQCQDVLNVLHNKYIQDSPTPFHQPVLHSLLQSFVGMVAACYCSANQLGPQLTRPVQLSQQFKKLLGENIRTTKSPSAYAARLNVSESYLNEALKKATGFSVSYWIIKEVTMEAKRLLYYSDLNVKQIAHQLGYEDHTYFSRLFKKAEDLTPLAFRAKYHK